MMPLPLGSAPRWQVSIGNSDRPTYAAHFSVNPSVAMDLISVKAAPGTVLRIKQIIFTNLGQQTTAGSVDITFGYASDLGSGGAAHGAAHNYGFADGDPASGAVARMGDTALAPNLVLFGHLELFVPQAKVVQTPFDFQFHDSHKAPTVAGDNAAAKAFVLRHAGAAGAVGLAGFVEWTEESVP